MRVCIIAQYVMYMYIYIYISKYIDCNKTCTCTRPSGGKSANQPLSSAARRRCTLYHIIYYYDILYHIILYYIILYDSVSYIIYDTIL